MRKNRKDDGLKMKLSKNDLKDSGRFGWDKAAGESEKILLGIK